MPRVVFYRIWAWKEAILKAFGGTVEMISDTEVP
jgi:phosphopantetheinyl transferase